MKMGNYLLNNSWSCTFKYNCVVHAWVDEGDLSWRRLIAECLVPNEMRFHDDLADSGQCGWDKVTRLKSGQFMKSSQNHHKLKVFKHLYSQNHFWISYCKLDNHETFSKCTSSFPSDSKKCVSQREELLWPPTTIIERFSI